jgi:hypothetical protein
MSADTLTQPSRDFYERAKLKVAASLAFAAGSLMLLGFCAEYGGQSNYYRIILDQNGLSN